MGANKIKKFPQRGGISKVQGRLQQVYGNSNDGNGFGYNPYGGGESYKNCNCPTTYIPFCGTDGITYANKCTLECARSNNKGLGVKFEGVCPVKYNPYQDNSGNYEQWRNTQPTRKPFYTTLAPVWTTRKYYTGSGSVPPLSAESKNLCTNCACPYSYEPICASDGKTYSNNCQFNCSKKCNPYLKMQYKSSCDTGSIRRPATNLQPPGSYGSNYGNRQYNFNSQAK